MGGLGYGGGLRRRTGSDELRNVSVARHLAFRYLLHGVVHGDEEGSCLVGPRHRLRLFVFCFCSSLLLLEEYYRHVLVERICIFNFQMSILCLVVYVGYKTSDYH